MELACLFFADDIFSLFVPTGECIDDISHTFCDNDEVKTRYQFRCNKIKQLRPVSVPFTLEMHRKE